MSQDLDRARLKALTMMEIAETLSRLSCCKKRRVGAIVTTKSYSAVVGIGFNGPARGLSNDSCNGGKPCGCVHAEANALVKCLSSPASVSDIRDGSRDGLTMFCTLAPCSDCAKLILNSGAIGLVLYKAPWVRTSGVKDLGGLVTLRAGGVGAIQLGEDGSY